jgi:hypothetical protein
LKNGDAKKKGAKDDEGFDTDKLDISGKIPREELLKGPCGDNGPMHPNVSMMKIRLIRIPDENGIVATWIDAGDIPQLEFDDKILFFNNEDILNE